MVSELDLYEVMRNRNNTWERIQNISQAGTIFRAEHDFCIVSKCHYGNAGPLVRQMMQCNVFFDVITNCLNSFFGSLLGNVDGVN